MCSSLFQGISLRFYASILYFYVLGYQICWFPNLIYEKGWSFCMLKISVHLGFGTQFFTKNILNEFGSCRAPNRAYDNFLESPGCLVCFCKISSYVALWFRSYRSWSEGCSQGVRFRATNFEIFVRGFPAIKRGDYFS